MAIVYRCKNCGTRFKVKEYIALEIAYTTEKICIDDLTQQGRKCNSCGKTITIEDKTIEM